MSALIEQTARADGPTYQRTTPTLIEVIGRSIWRALKRAGRRRAARELMAMREVAGDAASVRALANRVRKSDPGFASDLYAAADRHEREHEVAGSGW